MSKVKVLSLILTLLLLFTSVAPLTTVFAENETYDTVIAGKPSEEYEADDEPVKSFEVKAPQITYNTTTEEITTEEISDFLDTSDGKTQSNAVTEIPENPVPVFSESVETSVEELVTPTDGESKSDDRTAPEGSYELNAVEPYITASSPSLEIKTDTKASVTLGYGGVKASVYFQFEKNNDHVALSWGEWNKNKKDLNITGVTAGTTTITVNLRSSHTGKILASETLDVKVTSLVNLSLSQTSLDTVYNANKSVNVTIDGISNISTISYQVTYGNSAKLTWGSFSGNSIPLYVKGVDAGVTTVKIFVSNKDEKVLATTMLNIYVTKNAALSLTGNVSGMVIGNTRTITTNHSGAYGTLRKTFSVSGSSVSCSWSGQNISVKALQQGSSTLTVRLLNSSDDVLATKTVTINVESNISLTSSVPSVSLTSGSSQTITISFAGVNTSVTFYAYMGDKSIASAEWVGSWQNTSHQIKITGVAPGSTVLRIDLVEADTEKVLKTLEIPIAIANAATASLSATNLSVKANEQAAVYLTVRNISGEYGITYYRASGSCFTINYDASGSSRGYYKFIIMGTTAGTGTAKFDIEVDDKVIATVSCNITVSAASNKPSIRFSNNIITMNEYTTATNYIYFTGIEKGDVVAASTSASNIHAVFGRWEGNALTLNITAYQAGTAVITAYILDANRNERVSSSFTVDVKSTGTPVVTKYDIDDISYSFENYSATIPLSTFKKMFGNTSLAEALHYYYQDAGGVCFGMSATTMMFSDKKYLTTSNFGQSDMLSLSKTASKYPALNLPLNVFIEMMYITQLTRSSFNNRNYSLDDLCDHIEAGNLAEILIDGDDSGHAITGYHVDRERDLVYISDCNYPGGDTRYMKLFRSSTDPESYVGWEYNLGGTTIWSSAKGGGFCFLDIDSINYDWANQGKHQTFVFNSLLATNSNSFNVYDVEDNLVATYSDGEFDTELENTYQLFSYSYNPDSADNDSDYNLFYLPTDFYTIKNTDEDIDSFNADMVNIHLGVHVETDADEVVFAVSDEYNLCQTEMELDKDDKYNITLMSSREGEEDINIRGKGTMNNGFLSLSMTNGKLNYSSTMGATVDTAEESNFYTITADSTQGGSISNKGRTDALRYSDLTYTITPDDGYTISDVKVNGKSVGAVSEYTFSQIEEDAEIKAYFCEKRNAINLTVNNPSVTSFNYGDKIRLTATTENVPDTANLIWETDNDNVVSLTLSQDGKECTVTCIGSGEVNVTAKLVDANGNEFVGELGLQSSNLMLTGNSNFILRILSFIKNLFRLNRFVG